jgi:hypothetical protein
MTLDSFIPCSAFARAVSQQRRSAVRASSKEGERYAAPVQPNFGVTRMSAERSEKRTNAASICDGSVRAGLQDNRRQSAAGCCGEARVRSPVSGERSYESCCTPGAPEGCLEVRTSRRHVLQSGTCS